MQASENHRAPLGFLGPQANLYLGPQGPTPKLSHFVLGPCVTTALRIILILPCYMAPLNTIHVVIV